MIISSKEWVDCIVLISILIDQKKGKLAYIKFRHLRQNFKKGGVLKQQIKYTFFNDCFSEYDFVSTGYVAAVVDTVARGHIGRGQCSGSRVSRRGHLRTRVHCSLIVPTSDLSGGARARRRSLGTPCVRLSWHSLVGWGSDRRGPGCSPYRLSSSICSQVSRLAGNSPGCRRQRWFWKRYANCQVLSLFSVNKETHYYILNFNELTCFAVQYLDDPGIWKHICKNP